MQTHKNIHKKWSWYNVKNCKEFNHRSTSIYVILNLWRLQNQSTSKINHDFKERYPYIRAGTFEPDILTKHLFCRTLVSKIYNDIKSDIKVKTILDVDTSLHSLSVIVFQQERKTFTKSKADVKPNIAQQEGERNILTFDYSVNYIKWVFKTPSLFYTS